MFLFFWSKVKTTWGRKLEGNFFETCKKNCVFLNQNDCVGSDCHGSEYLHPVMIRNRSFHLLRSRQDRYRCELRPPSAHTLPETHTKISVIYAQQGMQCIMGKQNKSIYTF